MSIGSSPFQGGGSASIADATESTAGKIRIATTSESNTGTNDVTAMTPAKVKARIDAALVGGIEYKGIFNVTSATPDLSNASKGDLYVVSGSGTLYGKDFNAGDHLLVNDDMGGVITNSKIDKVDNTDQVSSVNALTGAVVLSGANLDGDHSPSNYSATTDKIEKHLEGIDTALGARQPLDAQLTDVAGLTPADGAFIVGDGSNFVAESGATARASLGLAIGSDVQAFDAQLTDVAGLTPADGAFIVGDGSNFVAESGATARASLGLAIGSDVQAFDAQLTDVAGLTPSNNHVIVGDGSNFTAAQLDLNKLSDVSYTAGASIDNYVLTYDHSSTSWGAEAVGASSDTLDTVTGRGATTSNAVQVGGLNIAGSYALPTSDGSPGQILKTDGSGALTFQSLGSISTQAANSVNITGGAISGITDLAIADGGTGASTEAQARTNLGLAIGSDVQAFDAQLTDVAGLTPADGAFIVGDGSNFVAESGATARASLGLAIGSDVQAFDAQLTDVAGLTPSNNHVIVGDGSNFTAAQLDLNKLSDVSYTAGASIDNYVLTYDHSSTSWGAEAVGASSDTLDTVTGRGATTSNAVQVGGLNIAGAYALPTSDGSPGQILKTDGSGALTFQSLGSISTQAANSVNITGGAISGITDLAIADGGTGASTEAQARTNLGLAIGSDVQAFDAQLTDVAGLTPADGAFIVGDGSNFVAESGATARASLGLAIGSDVQAFDAQLTDVAGLTPADGAFIVGDGSNFVAESGATARASLGLVIGTDVLSDVVQDTTPQLGGDLDVNGQDISTTSGNAKIGLKPHGTGFTELIGNTTGGNNPGAIRFNCEQNTHGVIIKSPLHSDYASGGDYTLTLPTGLPASDKVLQSSSTGVLSWVAQTSGGGGWTYSAITADPSPAQSGYHYSCGAGNQSFTLSLPPISGVSAGEEIRVKNMGSGTITIDSNGSEQIDGSTNNYVLDVQYSAVTLVSTGSAWEII